VKENKKAQLSLGVMIW